MSIPRKHHFIPVFYLKQWATGGKLIEYAKKRGRFIWKSVGLDATGFQRDLYSFPELPSPDAQHIEKVFLNYADQKAAHALSYHLGVAPPKWMLS